MKKILTTLSLFLPLYISAQDIVLFRDGVEKEFKVVQVNSDVTLCKENEKKNAKEMILDNSGIYMIKFEKRGNLFFGENGERFSGPTIKKKNKNSSIIYLKSGKEIEVYNLELTATEVFFYPESPKILEKKEAKIKSKEKWNKLIGKETQEVYEEGAIAPSSIPKSEVFLVKYPDGTKDILTPFIQDRSQADNNIKNKEQENREVGQTKPKNEPITYPCEATIITSQGANIEALVLSDDGETISYKKLSNIDGPVYKISKTNITGIHYKPNNTNVNQQKNEDVEVTKTEEKAEATRTFPCNATIRTKKGTVINAIVYSDDGKMISYKLKRNPNGSTYKLSYSNIKEIKYN